MFRDSKAVNITRKSMPFFEYNILFSSPIEKNAQIGTNSWP